VEAIFSPDGGGGEKTGNPPDQTEPQEKERSQKKKTIRECFLTARDARGGGGGGGTVAGPPCQQERKKEGRAPTGKKVFITSQGADSEPKNRIRVGGLSRVRKSLQEGERGKGKNILTSWQGCFFSGREEKGKGGGRED